MDYKITVDNKQVDVEKLTCEILRKELKNRNVNIQSSAKKSQLVEKIKQDIDQKRKPKRKLEHDQTMFTIPSFYNPSKQSRSNEENSVDPDFKQNFDELFALAQSLEEQEAWFPQNEPVLSKLFDFEDIVKRIQTNRELLKKVPWQSQVVVLPDICISRPNSFKIDETTNSIRMVNRFRDQTNPPVVFSPEEWYRKAYFNGCKGVGKSYIVYQLVCQLMTNPNNVVVYIPVCDEDVIFRVLRTLFLECKSLNDEEELDNLIDSYYHLLFLPLTVDQLFSDAHRVIYSFECVLRRLGKELILVFDQTEKILATESLQKLFIENLADEHGIIFCFTNQNDVYDHRLRKYVKRTVIHPVFSKTDLHCFMAQSRTLTKAIRENETFAREILKSDTIELILEQTGAIPLEIERFMEAVSENVASVAMDRWTDAYLLKYQAQYSKADMEAFYQGQTKIERKLRQNLSAFTGDDVEHWDDTYDKRIIYLHHGKSISEDQMRPICPAALKLLMSFYKPYFKTIFFFRLYFSSIDHSDIMKRKYHIKKCLTLTFMLNKTAKLQVISLSESKNRTTSDIELSHFEQWEFLGRVPSEGFKQNSLFVPMMRDYPAYDFFYLDNTAKVVYFFKVVLEKNAFTVVLENDANEKAKLVVQAWREKLPDAEFIDIYLVLRDNFDEKLVNRNCNFAYLDNFEHWFRSEAN